MLVLGEALGGSPGGQSSQGLAEGGKPLSVLDTRKGGAGGVPESPPKRLLVGCARRRRGRGESVEALPLD